MNAHSYTVTEIREALRVLHQRDAEAVLHHLAVGRIDRRQQDALNRMHALAESMKSATGAAWLALQDQFTRAMEDSDRAEKDATALHEARR